MSREETILHESHWKFVEDKGISSINTRLYPEAYKQQAIIAMQQYAKEMSIGFSLWKNENFVPVEPGNYQGLFVSIFSGNNLFTDSELYDNYLKTKNRVDPE